LPDFKRSKLGLSTSKCVFLGYAFHSKSYHFLELDSNVIIESRDVEFFESNIIKNSYFLKQVLLITKIFLKILFQKMKRNLKLENPKELEKKKKVLVLIF
jgi:hypothetical protein